MSNSQYYGGLDGAKSRDNSVGYSIAKVFGYMFLWLLITSVVTLGTAFLFSYLNNHASTAAAKNNIVLAGMVVAIVSAIGLIIVQIALHVVLFRGRHKILAPAIIYSSLFGLVLGVLSFMIDRAFVNGWPLIGIAFGSTTLTFGVMALIALTSKSRLNFLGFLGIGIFVGLGLTSMFMLIFMLLFPRFFIWWYWVVSLGTFLAVMLITIWDIRNVKTMAENGALSENLSMYLAFNLYTDFMYIFVRILYFVLMIFGRSRN
ncbi:MAG: Bax inhibitor-1 family protein [Bacilli bacterium]|nr:Bax inhibitor-1 family protein [Bacilli bacterium]